ncbi:ABC transporter ATP-binding protein [Phaeovibrio sulfidiphilus]|uniref:ABC transporter ATP-binding protein n=1 Tax=Phaeovibrio sulfidiphilus TaxID=1220600 RepID=A0A8J6YV11_9PROT|nr:ABC transporter ATP-binding protein [Phaeovibrio sulfidiphilus]MBE1236929.1 ABC transporter ATP-binding protein [Phaeovibrio sulfidiphilus]
MIRIRGLSYVYALGRSREGRTALDGLDLDIAAGTMTILAGPNGSGKSTLFRLLSGLALPSRGSVEIGGFDLFAAPAQARALLGVVFQSPALDRHLSVEENLSLHGALFGLRGRVLRDRIRESLSWSGLTDRLPDRVGTLSGGLARQVELAKALMSAPSVLLLDEPTTGLDPAARRSFLEQLARLKREREMTILMTSHVFSEAENADRVAILSQGRLLAHDTPAALCGRLGRNVLVVNTPSEERARALLPSVAERLGHSCVLCGSEIRLELGRDEPPVPLIDAVLDSFRDEITGVAVREPTLDDVFVHLTGAGPGTSPFVPKPQMDLAS